MRKNESATINAAFQAIGFKNLIVVDGTDSVLYARVPFGSVCSVTSGPIWWC